MLCPLAMQEAEIALRRSRTGEVMKFHPDTLLTLHFLPIDPSAGERIQRHKTPQIYILMNKKGL